MQLIPAEVLLSPGQKQTFHVQMFNAIGKRLGPAKKVEYSIATQDGKSHKTEAKAEGIAIGGIGTLKTADGVFEAAADAGHTAMTVTADVDGVTAQARIRVVPPLPWKFDFNEVPIVEVTNPVTKTKSMQGEPPVTWVGIRHRHVVRDIDGEKVMVKITTIPRGTRSQGWMGPWQNMHDYTIQADMRGTAVKTDEGFTLPDMGLIAQRYTLDVMGQKQQLQLRTWTSQIATRFSKNVPFEWKGNVWYTIKFSASVENGKAVLRGKVWPRDQAEPKDWMIEAEDEEPNLVGAPGLFGNASVGEIAIDNVSVTPNPTKTAAK
ncbi:MAG: hypothetical protein QM811_24125 [Pirellulales bacterium]